MKTIAAIITFLIATGFTTPQIHVKQFNGYNWNIGEIIGKYAVDMHKKGFETKAISIWCQQPKPAECYGMIVMEKK